MPVGIVIASIMGVILMIWIIKRRRADPPVEFRQDTMRYITIGPDKPKRNQQPVAQTQQAVQPEDVSASTVMAHEHVTPRDDTSEMHIAPKPVMADESDAELMDACPDTGDVSDTLFETPDRLVNDER